MSSSKRKPVNFAAPNRLLARKKKLQLPGAPSLTIPAPITSGRKIEEEYFKLVSRKRSAGKKTKIKDQAGSRHVVSQRRRKKQKRRRRRRKRKRRRRRRKKKKNKDSFVVESALPKNVILGKHEYFFGKILRNDINCDVQRRKSP